jgi:5-methylcytosine-specific restriction protein A
VPRTGEPWSEEERAELLRIYMECWDESDTVHVRVAQQSPVLAPRLADSKDPRFLLRREWQNLSTVLAELGREWRHSKPRGDGLSNAPRAMYLRLLETMDDAASTDDRHLLEARAARLLSRGVTAIPAGNNAPSSTSGPQVRFLRDPRVVAYVRREAAGQCELCDQPAPFVGHDGRPHLEVHHVTTLASGGRDTPDNAVALCPNCHQACHHANNRDDLVQALYAKVSRLRP